MSEETKWFIELLLQVNDEEFEWAMMKLMDIVSEAYKDG